MYKRQYITMKIANRPLFHNEYLTVKLKALTFFSQKLLIFNTARQILEALPLLLHVLKTPIKKTNLSIFYSNLNKEAEVLFKATKRIKLL